MARRRIFELSVSPQPLLSKVARRRANSCKPCRDSKSKCPGGIPCTTCQKKRHKPRCYYLSPFSRDGENDDPTQVASVEPNCSKPVSAGEGQETAPVNEEDTVGLNDLVSGPHDDFYGTLSLARSVDEFKQLLPTEGPFQDIVDSIRPAQIFDLEIRRAYNVPTSHLVALQQVRHNLDFQGSAALQRLYARYYSIRDQLTFGLATQAWSAFASLIRDAELFGLKEFANPVTTWDDMKDPRPGRCLWWLLVELDTQLSFLLGRRPSIDPSHNIPKPDPSEIRSAGNGGTQDVLDFTKYMIEFLNHVHQDRNDRHSHLEDRRTMLQSELNRLHSIRSSLPVLPARSQPDATTSSIAQHQVDIHLVLIVLYCQILRSISPENTISARLRDLHKSAVKSNYKELLKSLRATIDIFDYSYGLDHAKTVSSWPRCFGVFCAASMLGIARLRQEADVDTDSIRIQRALEIFVDLANSGQAPGIAQLAAESLAEILDGIKGLEQQPSGSTGALPVPSNSMTTSENVKQPSGPRLSRKGPKIKAEAPALKRSNTSDPEEDVRSGKRVRSGTEAVIHENLPYSQAMSLEGATTAPPQEPTESQSLEQQPNALAATTSFSDQVEYYETGYVPTHPDSFHEYHPGFRWVHPPTQYAPPMYDLWQQSQFQLDENITADANPHQRSYHPPLALSMDTVHQLENTMQHQGLIPRQQISPTHSPIDDYNLPADVTTMQQSQAQQSTNISPSRRQSTAPMEGRVMQQSGRPADQFVRQRWQAQRQPSPYDLRAHMPYNVTMTNEGLLVYNQQLEYQQQNHIPTTHVVTTGSFLGASHGQHWEWTG